MFTIANVGMCVPWHDHASPKMSDETQEMGDVVDSPECIGVGDINNVLGILSGLQIPLDEGRPGDGHHSRCDQRDRNGDAEKTSHGRGLLGERIAKARSTSGPSPKPGEGFIATSR